MHRKQRLIQRRSGMGLGMVSLVLVVVRQHAAQASESSSSSSSTTNRMGSNADDFDVMFDLSFSQDGVEVRFPYNNFVDDHHADPTTSSQIPSDLPSQIPSDLPSQIPSDLPSLTPSQVPTESPTASYPYLEFLGMPPPTASFPLQSCQGHCESHDDCDVGLHCYKNVPDNNMVPHCEGTTLTTFSNYCVPIPPTSVTSYGGTPRTPLLQMCEGDCDSDNDCVPGLFCFQRGSYQEVPGCDGGESDGSKTDYCTDQLAPTAAPYLLEPPPKGSITYRPGNLTTFKDDLLLSEGLDAKLIATSGWPVALSDGTGYSNDTFHGRPDGAATFAFGNPKNNNGGFVYVSNSEMLTPGKGGVGAITFDNDGNVLQYKRLLQNTTWNCGGGASPWNTWLSCEEYEAQGQIYQVDPFGIRPPQVTSFPRGRWEAFAYDVRNPETPRFFATEDRHNGALARFTPSNPKWNSLSKQWNMLHGTGIMEYLLLSPISTTQQDAGTFSWTTDRSTAQSNAAAYYPHTEGIDVHEGIMYVTCKKIKMLYLLDLDQGTYTRLSSQSGLFDGSPDQVSRIVDDPRGDLLYFTEEGGQDAGVHARDALGRFYTILESPVHSGETTGLAFSPNGKFLLVAYQTVGKLYLVWRRDGLPFYGDKLDVKYHEAN